MIHRCFYFKMQEAKQAAMGAKDVQSITPLYRSLYKQIASTHKFQGRTGLHERNGGQEHLFAYISNCWHSVYKSPVSLASFYQHSSERQNANTGIKCNDKNKRVLEIIKIYVARQKI